MNTLVTLVDNKIINQVAAQSLILNLQRYSVSFDKLFLLCPSSVSLSIISTWLAQHGVVCKKYELGVSEDPYYAKFLLESFVLDYDVEDSHQITYLDPDHVVLGNFTLPSCKNNFLIVSSEKVEGNNNDNNDVHYNTSLISGNKFSWRKVVIKWMQIYKNILSKAETRYREEIAFSIAAKYSNVRLIHAPTELQGCYKDYHEDSRLFHYGGEYLNARKIKACLNMEASSKICIQTLMADATNEFERRLYKELNTSMENIHTR